MNTSQFKSELNMIACAVERDMDAICKIGAARSATPGDTPGAPGASYKPLTADELQLMISLLATAGRGSIVPSQQTQLTDLMTRYTANGGTFPIPGQNISPIPGINPTPTAGSFATSTIETWHDLINFLKAATIIVLGASFTPSLIIPTNIILTVSFIYALRFQLKKFTNKFYIHGHQ